MTAAGAPVGATTWRATSLLRSHKVSLVAAAVIGLCGAAASLCQPIVIGWVVARVLSHGSLVRPFMLLIGLFVAEGLLGAAQAYLLGRAGNQVVRRVRFAMVSGIIRSPMSFLAGARRGDLMSTTVADTSILGGLLAQSIATLMSSIIMIVGSLAFMAYLDLVLTGAVAACVVVAGIPTLLLARRLRQVTQRNRDCVGAFGAGLDRALSGVSTVKVSRAERREEDRIGELVEQSYGTSMRATRVNAAMSPAMGLAVQASFMVVFTVGAYRLSSGALSTGDFSSYVLYLLYLIAPLVNLLTGVAQLQQSAASAARVRAVLDSTMTEGSAAPVTPPAVTAGRHSDHPTPTLELTDVGFTHAGGPELHDVSIDVQSPGLTAIVGPSGAGKSTIFGLMVRLWNSGVGRISLHGKDIAHLPLSELRGRIGYVEQNAAVLDGTLRDNLVYANPDATAVAIDDVLRRVCLREWVDGLPAGLDTQVGEGGTAISGGERQRIAIARMLLAEPDVLLLDEATAHLDATSAAQLDDTIRDIARERAVVTVAHQLSTVSAADRVVLVDKGTVRAQGTHNSLVQSDELYRRLHGNHTDNTAAAPDTAAQPTDAALSGAGV